MTRFSYVNGHFTPHHSASIHIEDRGFQFADAVYDVIALIQGKLVDQEEHIDRFERSSKHLGIPFPLPRKTLLSIIKELVHRNRYQHGMVYLQLSRGSAPRVFQYPTHPAPSLVITVRPFHQKNFLKKHKDGVTVITTEDKRWAHPHIKTVNLLPAAMAKQEALEKGAYDALFLKNGHVTEASSANFWCVFGKEAYTYPSSPHILDGLTKRRLFDLIQTQGFTLHEKKLTLEEVYAADEAFLTSSNIIALPIVKINDTLIGHGKPGPMTLHIQQAYFHYVDSL